MIIGVDPGTTESAIVLWDGMRIVQAVQLANDRALLALQVMATTYPDALLAVEMIASYGMPVGREVFETCVWVGRYVQAVQPLATRYVYRREVKLALCGSARAKDGNVRQALIDAYGAVGTKKNPGPLYGLRNDLWQAFGVAAVSSGTPIPAFDHGHYSASQSVSK